MAHRARWRGDGRRRPEPFGGATAYGTWALCADTLERHRGNAARSHKRFGVTRRLGLGEAADGDRGLCVAATTRIADEAEPDASQVRTPGLDPGHLAVGSTMW